MRKVYRLQAQYTITSELVDDETQFRGGYTGERLVIDDTFDLSSGGTLTEVLGAVDAIHKEMRALAERNAT